MSPLPSITSQFGGKVTGSKSSLTSGLLIEYTAIALVLVRARSPWPRRLWPASAYLSSCKRARKWLTPRPCLQEPVGHILGRWRLRLRQARSTVQLPFRNLRHRKGCRLSVVRAADESSSRARHDMTRNVPRGTIGNAHCALIRDELYIIP